MIPSASSSSRLLDLNLDPLTFYNILPTDDLISDKEAQDLNWGDLPARLLQYKFEKLNETDLEHATILLSSKKAFELSKEQMSDLADHFSREYIDCLRSNNQDRKKKMFVQRLNFFLRSLIDSDAGIPEGSQSTSLPYQCPWDWIQRDKTSIYIVSEEKNVVLRKDNIDLNAVRLGLPTQVDDIDGTWFSIGSHYTPGGYMMSESETRPVNHEQPIVLIFEHRNKLLFIDSTGSLYDLESRELVFKFQSGPVSKARKFGSSLYLLNWTEPYALFILDLDQLSVRRISLNDIFVVNDLIQSGDTFYLVDKQQGYLFAYDKTFKLQQKTLGFGRGPGKLFDPVSIRPSNKEGWLDILNWVPGDISSIPVA